MRKILTILASGLLLASCGWMNNFDEPTLDYVTDSMVRPVADSLGSRMALVSSFNDVQWVWYDVAGGDSIHRQFTSCGRFGDSVWHELLDGFTSSTDTMVMVGAAMECKQEGESKEYTLRTFKDAVGFDLANVARDGDAISFDAQKKGRTFSRCRLIILDSALAAKPDPLFDIDVVNFIGFPVTYAWMEAIVKK